MPMTPVTEHPAMAIARRPPDQVMRLGRMGSAHPTRLSFLRILLRRVAEDGWQFDRPVWEVNANGVGRAVYRAIGPERTYSLVAFAHDLPSHMRSDRVIATAWDATFTLFDGTPTPADLDRLAANVPLQEDGRLQPSELSMSRANRSVRLWQHVIDRLAQGLQPDMAQIDAVGYLMRTTAVYGSGKFGAADRDDIAARPELCAPFQAEMLSVWLIRQFTVDLVEHMAAACGGTGAKRLLPRIKRRLGVGNSTGLGMAPFIVRHPVLLNNWMMAREEALARVRSLPQATAQALHDLRAACNGARDNAAYWQSKHPLQLAKLRDLRADIERIGEHIREMPGTSDLPWDDLWRWGEQTLTAEGQEQLLALMLEPHGALVDGLSHCMGADETAAFGLDGSMRCADLRTIIKTRYDWALAVDFSRPEAAARFWYVSEEKMEPRLGDRLSDDGVEREQPLCIARLAHDLYDALADCRDDEPVATFLLRAPEHRFIVRRAQVAARYPYAEVRDNLIAADMLPIDLMRCKLAFFGANHFDPWSDKWVRISLFQGAPYPLDAGGAVA